MVLVVGFAGVAIILDQEELPPPAPTTVYAQPRKPAQDTPFPPQGPSTDKINSTSAPSLPAEPSTTSQTSAPLIPTTSYTPAPDPPVIHLPGGLGSGWQAMWEVIQVNFPDAWLMSGLRNSICGQYHCRGFAIDIGASVERMREINIWIATTYPDTEQLIHGPGPYNLLDGKPFFYGYETLNGHYDHVHWAKVGNL